MNVFSHILVGVDNSPASLHAVALAARLTREHSGRLTLVHVVDWLPLVAEVESSAAGALIDPSPIVSGLRQHGEAVLAQAAESAARFGVDAERELVEGVAAQTILSSAAREHCSLIVMATHGRRGLSRFFLGSTTEAVLRESTIPVLTVRPETKIAHSERRCFARIAVGIDDSDPSDAAVRSILALPPEDSREVIFYSVADVDAVVGGRGLYYGTILEDLRRQAQNVVNNAVAAAREHGINAQGRVLDGSSQDELIAAAEHDGADLLVLGSHGRRGLRRFLVGSVAENIVRSAPVPVLVVRYAMHAMVAA